MITIIYNPPFSKAYENKERLSILDERYAKGWVKPNYPVPAIPLTVKYDYVGCVNVDNVSNPDDPIIVYMYDSWNKCEVT